MVVLVLVAFCHLISRVATWVALSERWVRFIGVLLLPEGPALVAGVFGGCQVLLRVAA